MQSYPEFPHLRGIFGASQKNDLKSYLVVNTIEALPFYLTHFRSLGQKSKNNFVQFLVQMRTRKFAFETY
jgi:hypothetical protein